MDDYKKNLCENLCENLCDKLTVIKGYLDLSERNDKKYFNELRKEIDDTVTLIMECLDEMTRWNK